MRRTDDPTRRALGPRVEALETRDLPSSAAAPWHAPARAPGRLVAAQSGADVPETPPDRADRPFFAAFAGSYAVGAGRIEGQALRTYINSAGTSNTFLHGQAQVAIATPSDPSGSLSGTASLFDKNYTQSGNILVLDLEGDPQGSPDGRPTTLTWSVGDDSSGTFSGAQGEGTLTIRYHPGGPRAPHARASGKAGIKFLGRITINGTTNPFRVT